VSQAIVAQMEKTRQPSVFLDLSHLEAERVRKRFSFKWPRLDFNEHGSIRQIEDLPARI
jgi:aspartate oxidase